MNIGIVCYQLSTPKITGIERYIRQMILGLNRIDQKNSYFLYLYDKPYEFEKLDSNFTYRISPYRRYWNQRVLPKLLMDDDLDIIFFPGSILPNLGKIKAKIVSHFHDLSFIRYPSSYSYLNRIINRVSLSRTLKYSNRIITSSNAIKNDLMELTKISADKISVLSLAASNSFNLIPNHKDRSGILCVGRIEERKNLVNLIKGYCKYADTNKDPEQLTLVGSLGFKGRKVLDLIDEKSSIGYKIDWKNYLSDRDLIHLYHKSKCLIFSSFYEGFGLPILEAFAAKTPVICSDIPVFNEIADDAALYFSPNDPDDIAKSIERVASNESTTWTLTEKGTKRLKYFSWDNFSRGLIKIFEDV